MARTQICGRRGEPICVCVCVYLYGVRETLVMMRPDIAKHVSKTIIITLRSNGQ